MSRPFQVRLFVVLSTLGLLFTSGCARTQSLTKAPVTKIHTGGSLNERKQVYTLRRVKWRHTGSHGKVTGSQYFTDTKLPISGARVKDKFTIHSNGPYQGTYTIDKVIRIRTTKKRQVILKIAESFTPTWKEVHKGSGGLSTQRREGERIASLFTDISSFLPDVPVGTQVIISGQEHTVIRTTIVKIQGAKLQRVAYELSPSPAKGIQSVSYSVRVPAETSSEKMKYSIYWRGSNLTGFFYTIGINRRRYSQKELEDVLKSEKSSKEALKAVPAKQGVATAFFALGSLAIGVGGFLALVRRDDFPGTSQAIPWAIVGGGLLFTLGVSLPINISTNNDYLAAAKLYNQSIHSRLKLPKDIKTAKASPNKSLPQQPKQPSSMHTVSQH